MPVLPISGWQGDNLIKKTENMAWWKGMDVIDYNLKGDKFHIDTLLDVLNNMVNKPERQARRRHAPPHLRRVQDQGCR